MLRTLIQKVTNRARQNPSSAGQTSLHFGRVSAIETATCRARVNVPDLGVETYWLPVGQYRTGANKSYWMPSVGELIACWLDNKGEQGILCGIYSASDPPPANSLTELHLITGTIVIQGDLVITGNIDQTGNYAQTGHKSQDGVLSITSTGNPINGKGIAVVGAVYSAGHALTSDGQ